MSPTEFDLRAALRDGEGDGVDPDLVIAGGRRQRAQRRARIMSTAAVAAFVAAAGVGGTLIWNHSGTDTNASSGAGDQSTARHAPVNGAALAPSAGSAGGALRGMAAPPCPNSLPRYLLPGGGSPGQFDASGPLFAKPVASVIVCSYGTPAMALGQHPVSVPAKVVLTGSQASRLVASLEHASKTKSAGLCPTISNTDERELAIIGITASGTALPTVTANLSQPACDVRVTNGTAVRYEWSPPADLRQLLISLTPRTTLTASPPVLKPSGKNHGSPIQS